MNNKLLKACYLKLIVFIYISIIVISKSLTNLANENSTVNILHKIMYY